MANLQVGVAGNGTVTVGAGASVHSPASNTLTLGTNGDERVRIDSSGTAKFSGNIEVDAGSNGMIDFGDITSGYGRLYADSTGTFIGSKSNDPLILRTNHTEVARLDEYGRMMIGQTAAVIASSSEFAEIVLSGKTRGAGITLKDVDANTQFQIRTDDAGGDPMTLMNASTNHPIAIRTNNAERLRITNGGKMLLGTANVPSNKNTVTPLLNVSGSGVLGSAQITRHTSVGGGGALLHLAGTRGSDVNSYTILQDGDGIGTLAFNAADGNEFVTAAEVKAAVDGTPGDNDMPGRLIFSTTADGASSVTERLRIASNGAFGIGGANYGSSGQVLTSQGSGSAVQWATASGGKLLQMVGSSSNTANVISTTTKTTTGLSQSITPSKAGSKLLFLLAGHYSQNHNGGSNGPQAKLYLYKQIGSGTDTEVHRVTYDYVSNNNSVYHSHHFAVTYFDSTATSNTSDAIKYTIYAHLLYGSHQMRMNPGGGYTSLVIQEYDA